MSISLVVVRHGRTAFNIEDRYLGALDPPLDAVGIEQAAALAHALPAALGGRPTALTCSPRLRARQTAAILATAWRLEASVIDAFAERNVGVYEGLTREEAQAAYPALWAQDITRQWHAAPTGGESIQAVFDRVTAGLDRLRRDFQGQTVVLVAHGFVAKVIRAILTDLSREEFFRYALKNGEFARYQLTT
ncbi:putative phosphoglycerate mutase [Pseudoduganella lurida]|uniref:Putative phosphoglycerate mutase n=1 Tax=Pseudoduganella lurida TaxID=1036180 RepID=A0A562RFV5_9BURK|nr:histidine phosphatase family protein [Pseudoduganella lurida]TWI67763.1 putative phosphoglycerate mutase [Pseudoduganella lurida]